MLLATRIILEKYRAINNTVEAIDRFVERDGERKRSSHLIFRNEMVREREKKEEKHTR